MFVIKNLRKEKKDGWTYLKADFTVIGGEKPYGHQVDLWFAIEDKDAKMLADDVYDAFAPFMLYLGMINHQDVHIEGSMSPQLYHSLTHYVMAIFDNFSKRTRRIKFTVDGLKEAKRNGDDLVGTGFSCGVDSLSTLYSNFLQEDDEHFRVNSLFYFNCGQNGIYDDEKTKELWRSRIKLHKKAQREMELPAYYIDSNLHAFYTPDIHDLPFSHVIYIAACCCALSVQRSVKRYYFANNLSYDEILEYGLGYRDKDLFEYSESFLAHLFSTERLAIILDGCEFTRAEKIERIRNWKIARENLDVCLDAGTDGRNCSKCSKCMRTLLVLEAMGALGDFENVFDLSTYRKNKEFWLLQHMFISNGQNDGVIKYLKERKAHIPPKIYAVPRWFMYKIQLKIDRMKEHWGGH